MFDCQGCPHKAHDGSCTYGVGCPHYGNPHFKPSRPETVKPLKKAGMTENRMTNADRLRAMSDEELAEWLYEYGGGAPNCDKELGTFDYKRCADCWLDWLQQEVEQ